MDSAPDLSVRAAADGALFRQLVAEGYDRCAEAYLRHSSGEEDLRLEPFRELMAELHAGAHVLDAGCGAGVPIATHFDRSLVLNTETRQDLGEKRSKWMRHDD